MNVVERLTGVMQVVRLLGLVTILVAALATSPTPASACSEQFITCSTATGCVSVGNEPCNAGGCAGTIKCKADNDCSGYYNVATVCVPDIPE